MKSKILDCFGTNKGSALNLNNCKYLKVKDNWFIRNKAQIGGAIFYNETCI